MTLTLTSAHICPWGPLTLDWTKGFSHAEKDYSSNLMPGFEPMTLVTCKMIACGAALESTRLAVDILMICLWNWSPTVKQNRVSESSLNVKRSTEGTHPTKYHHYGFTREEHNTKIIRLLTKKAYRHEYGRHNVTKENLFLLFQGLDAQYHH